MDNIYLVSDIKELPEASQIKEVEAAIKGMLPSGYKDFIESFGAGEFNSYLYLLSPEKIIEVTAEWKETLESDFWTEDSCLPMDLRRAVYIIAYTMDSDLFVFHPHKKDIYCLPRQNDMIHMTGETLSNAVSWTFESGKLIEASTDMFYRPEGVASHLRYRNSNPPDFNTFEKTLNSIGKADYVIRRDEFVDIFFRSYGAHVNYSQVYDQLTVAYDADHAQEFFTIIDKLFRKLGFHITEKANIPDK